MAKHCARLWLLGESADLTLVGRATARLDRVAVDLAVRSPESDIRVVQADFLDPNAIQATVDNIIAQGTVDIVLIAHGSLPDQTHCQNDLNACRETLEVNGISPVLFAEAFAKHMEQVSRGTIALISSVAGDRGRKSNYVYGSAKSLVTCYAEGMQHRFAGTGVRIVLIKPGPTDTPMTSHLEAQGMKLANVAEVSEELTLAIANGTATAYTPKKWKWIMRVIRHLPNAIFHRLDI